MRVRTITTTLAAALLFLVVIAAPAAANPFLSFGVINKDGSLYNFLYGEIDVADATAVGAFVSTDNIVQLSLWRGYTQGWYAEIESALGAAFQARAIGAGLWHTRAVSDSAAITGWAGAYVNPGASGAWIKASGELGIALSSSFAFFVGADTTLLKQPSESTTWLAVGYAF